MQTLADTANQKDAASGAEKAPPLCAKCKTPESECPGKTLYQHPRIMGGAKLCAECYVDSCFEPLGARRIDA
jgi:hypothetical protein